MDSEMSESGTAASSSYFCGFGRVCFVSFFFFGWLLYFFKILTSLTVPAGNQYSDFIPSI